MSEICFLMHWLAEHVKKSAKDQYAKYFWVIAVEFKEAAKFVSKLVFLTRRWVFLKNKDHYERKTKSKIYLKLILGALAGRAHLIIWKISIQRSFLADCKRP